MVWLFNAYPSLPGFDLHLKTLHVPTAMLDQGKKGKIMKQLGLVYAEVNDEIRYQKNNDDQVANEEKLNLFQRKRRVGDYLYRVNKGGKANFPSQLPLVDTGGESMVPHLSLAVSQPALYDQTIGILANSGESGKDWERPATLSIYSSGQLDQAYNVGVRLYGERGERESLRQRSQYAGSDSLDQSYQIFFRSKYSVDQVSGKLFFNQSNSPVLSSLIVERGDVRKKQLAFDLWRIAGLTVPDYATALLSVNGHQLGMHLIREPVNRKQWALKTGKHDLDFYSNGSGFLDLGWRWNVELNSWYKQVRGKLSMQLVDTYIDLEDLTKGVALRMFCGSSDWTRWAIIRDRQASNRWRWIDSNMDTCFSDQWSTSKDTIAEQHWLQVVMSKGNNKQWRITHHDLRALIFVELLNNDPEYSAYFLSLLERMMQRFAQGSNYNTAIFQVHGLSGDKNMSDRSVHDHIPPEELRGFVDRRSRFIREQIKLHFDVQS